MSKIARTFQDFVEKQPEKYSDNGVVRYARTEFSSMYIRQYNDGETGGYITMNVNGKRVGVRSEIVNGQRMFHVETGSLFEGDKKRSGWMTESDANRFIYENTKG